MSTNFTSYKFSLCKGFFIKNVLFILLSTILFGSIIVSIYSFDISIISSVLSLELCIMFLCLRFLDYRLRLLRLSTNLTLYDDGILYFNTVRLNFNLNISIKKFKSIKYIKILGVLFVLGDMSYNFRLYRNFDKSSKSIDIRGFMTVFFGVSNDDYYSVLNYLKENNFNV